jgi:hypothetical protein
LIQGNKNPVMTGMSLLSTSPPLTLPSFPAWTGLANYTVRRRRLGGVAGVLPIACQLPLQINDLFALLGDLPISLLDLLAEYLILSTQAFIPRRLLLCRQGPIMPSRTLDRRFFAPSWPTFLAHPVHCDARFPSRLAPGTYWVTELLPFIEVSYG